jgi:phosphoglycolate phosphatase
LRYRLIIFDMDGTLADSYPWFLTVVNAAAERFQFRHIEPGDADMLRRLNARSILKWLGVPRWKLPLIASHMRALKAQHIEAVPLFPGAAALLHALSDAGVRIAIVSSDTEANSRVTLGAENARLIDWFACGASMFGKPAKFRQVLRQSGFAATETLAIGDEIRDAEAAARAGIAFGAATWGYTHPDALRNAGPAYVFCDFDDVAAVLELRPAPQKN